MKKIDVHGFCDSSKRSSCTVAFIEAHHSRGSIQGLIASKSRLANQNATILRLELFTFHMAINLAQNLK